MHIFAHHNCGIYDESKEYKNCVSATIASEMGESSIVTRTAGKWEGSVLDHYQFWHVSSLEMQYKSKSSMNVAISFQDEGPITEEPSISIHFIGDLGKIN